MLFLNWQMNQQMRSAFLVFDLIGGNTCVELKCNARVASIRFWHWNRGQEPVPVGAGAPALPYHNTILSYSSRTLTPFSSAGGRFLTICGTSRNGPCRLLAGSVIACTGNLYAGRNSKTWMAAWSNTRKANRSVTRKRQS